MRRADRAVVERAAIERILRSCLVCHVAFTATPAPYLVPLHFGYRWDGALPVLYFHSASAGRKLELAKQQPLVGFALDRSMAPEGESLPCSWSARYESIIGEGRLEAVKSPSEREDGLRLLMEHYHFPGSIQFEPAALSAVEVLRLTVTALSAKQHGSVE